MLATQFSKHLWNAIADVARRSQSPREVYFAEVTRSDDTLNLVWTKDFGDVGIPLVAHTYSFAYYDTVPTGDAHDGMPITVKSERRSDPTNKNTNFLTRIVCPKRGDVVVVIDPWGTKRFPVCVGVVQSKQPWKEG